MVARTSLYHRLRLAIAWQWSRGVMVAEFVQWCRFFMTAIVACIMAAMGLLWFWLVVPLCAAYKYTIGLVTVAHGMSEAEVARLRRIIHSKDP